MRAFGIPVLIEHQQLRPNLDLCRELGLDFVELNMNLPYCFPERIPSEALRWARREGIRFSIHLHDELDLGSLQPSLREGHLRRCEEAVRWGQRHGVFLLNLHLNPGVHFTLPDRKVWVYERFIDEHLQCLQDSLAKLSRYAASKGMKVCLENTGHLTLPYMRRVLEQVLMMPNVGMCWDIGHDARTGFKEKDFLMEHLDKVWHMHFHDYDGVSDHQVPFSGNLDCQWYIDLARRHEMSVLIEVKTEEAIRSAVRLMRGRGMLDA